MTNLNNLGIILQDAQTVMKNSSNVFMMVAVEGLMEGFHGSAHVCIIYSPVHALWHRPSF